MSAAVSRDGSPSVAGRMLADSARSAEANAVTMADVLAWAENNRMKPTGNDVKDLASVNRMRALLELPQFSLIQSRGVTSLVTPPRVTSIKPAMLAPQIAQRRPETKPQYDEAVLIEAAQKAWDIYPFLSDVDSRVEQVKLEIPYSPWRSLIERHHAQAIDSAIRRLLFDVASGSKEIHQKARRPGSSGRPPTLGGAKLRADIQRAYRERAKSDGKVVAVVSRLELVQIRQVPIGKCTAKEVREWIEEAKASGRISMTNALFGEFLIKDLNDDEIVGVRWRDRDAEVSGAWMRAFNATQGAFEQVEGGAQ